VKVPPSTDPGPEGRSDSGRSERGGEKISATTVMRLSEYYRALTELEIERQENVSSSRLAEVGGITPSQVRKDLSYFGTFGRRGLGYNVSELRRTIRGILGLNRSWNVALVGAGNLGHALFSYGEFREQGFHVRAVFDVDPTKVGERWAGVEVSHFDHIGEINRRENIQIAILVTPAGAAQRVADRLVEAGIRGILNFAPRRLEVPDTVVLRNVNLSVALEGLSFSLTA
jgi:redox-sensing transcriptional repressor